MSRPVADYLHELYLISGVSVPETRGCPALFQLKPERGVIKVKVLDADLSSFESSPQVRNYLEHYGQIFLTNYRSFALWSWRGGKAVQGERYSIAPSAKEFWDKTHTVRNDPKHPEHERLWQCLR